MKRSMLILIMLASSMMVNAQAPEAFNYQAVVRNAEGEIAANTEVSFRISIRENAENGPVVYVETHVVNTSGNGLVNFQVGNGSVQQGDFSSIEWGSSTYYLGVELDMNGGNDYKAMTVQQLIAVPYAIHANTVTYSDNDETNELQTLSKNGTDITLSEGGGTVSVADDDNDPANELQSLSKNGDEITLSDGGGTVSVADNDNDPTNEFQTISKSGDKITLSDGGGVVSVADADDDPTNEYQDLSSNGETISLSKSGSSVKLSDLGHWTKTGSDLYFIRGNVGVGTQTPQHNFNVVGDSAILNLGASGTTWNKSAAGILRFSEAGDYQNGLCGFQFSHNGTTNKLSLEGGCLNVKDTFITFTRTGRIGIGTYDPYYALEINGDLGVSQYIKHAADNNTNMAFGDDEITLTAGGKRMINILESTDDTITFGDGSDVDINFNNDAYLDHDKQTFALFTSYPSANFALHSKSEKRGGFLNYVRYTGSDATYGTYTDMDFYGSNGACYGEYMSIYKSSSSNSSGVVIGLKTEIENWGDGATYGSSHDVTTSGNYTYPVYGLYVLGQDYQQGTTSARYAYGLWVKGTSYYSTGTSHTKGIYATYAGSAETEYAGYFSGSVYTTGSYLPSDIQLKTGVSEHVSSLDRIMAVKVYDYTYDTLKFNHMNLPSGQQTGFLAQEFSVHFPELTTRAMQAPLTEDELAYYEENGLPVPEGGKDEVLFTAVNYAGMVPHLTSAVQEQQSTIEAAQEQISTQQQTIEDLQQQLALLAAQVATLQAQIQNTGQ